ncbi:nucleotidyltransferase family protein [Sapientia aquatica]|uniref:Nucleotidyltransferase family protein n=1 Tax=Sapientia aquatica TaxID=1549640 RepID=A0A4R5VUL2_9BURK|nr:nucleotidyltransferase family protein [Sapientia aquatica]TDK62530.1 nucleotidyltransferase family protein [Sapientia aquatica]
MQPHKTVGILLAAGAGQRFDPTGVASKLMQPLPSGVSVAVQSATNLLRVLSNVVAVVRSEKLAQQLRQAGCEVHLFEQAQQGMGASLSFVMQKIKHSDLGASRIDSVLVGLADMPYIETSTIQTVLNELQQGADIVQPSFEQQAGHPVGFSSKHFAALSSLSGDVGARELVRQFPVCRVTVNDPGILRDIDYASDLPVTS